MFTQNSNIISEIYGHIRDEISRQIYMDRLNYSLSLDAIYIQQIVNYTIRSSHLWKNFCSHLGELSKGSEMVIFGAGIWGTILCRETKDIVRWKYLADSSPKCSVMDGIPVVAFDGFAEKYNDEYIVVSSYKCRQGMFRQLYGYGIPEEKIIDAGQVIYELTEKAIYFDLEALLPLHEKEVFIDAGCFDGYNTRRFFEWCNGRGFAYCFEPDQSNIKVLKTVLGNRGQYKIVPKALWSEKRDLGMVEQGNFASSVSADTCADANISTVSAVSVDEYLGDSLVTYIKMDIEGAELEAIKGAANVIRTQHPRLAVSIYHKNEDIWTIPDKILEYYPDYRFYLRHYSFSNYDTVLYAIP